MTKILVVIPCLNEEKHLGPLVDDIMAATANLPLQLVIADGGSRDRTMDIARELSKRYGQVALMHNPKRIQSAAINQAVAAYGHDATYLIRIDAHAGYPENYCRIVIDEADRTGAASVVVAMNTVGLTPFQKAAAAAQNSILGNGGSAHRSANADGKWVDHGHHALMRIDAFQSVGGYDEDFAYNEDAELDTRLTQAGYKIWLTAKTAITYYPRSAPGPLFRQYMGYGNGRLKNLLKHRTRPKLRQMIPAFILPAAVLALATPVIWLAALPLLAWAVFCLAYGLMLGIRNRNADLAIAGPAAMIMHAGWSAGFWHEAVTRLWNKSR